MNEWTIQKNGEKVKTDDFDETVHALVCFMRMNWQNVTVLRPSGTRFANGTARDCLEKMLEYRDAVLV